MSEREKAQARRDIFYAVRTLPPYEAAELLKECTASMDGLSLEYENTLADRLGARW